MLILNIIDSLDKMIKPFRDFVFKHHDNPVLWIVLFFIGVITFLIVYRKLQKEK